MRSWLGKALGIGLVILLGAASQLPGAAARCEGIERTHLCCCRAETAPAGNHDPAAAPTRGCCTAGGVPADAPSDRDNDGGCRCSLQAPALPFESPRFAPISAVAAIAPAPALPLRPARLVAVRAPLDSPCHAPPARSADSPRGPPLSAFDPIA